MEDPFFLTLEQEGVLELTQDGEEATGTITWDSYTPTVSISGTVVGTSTTTGKFTFEAEWDDEASACSSIASTGEGSLGIESLQWMVGTIYLNLPCDDDAVPDWNLSATR